MPDLLVSAALGRAFGAVTAGLDAGGRVRWRFDAAAPALVVLDAHADRELGRFAFRIAWPPGAGSCMALDALSASLDAPDPANRDLLAALGERLQRRLRRVEAQFPQYLALLFPRRADGRVDWSRSPLFCAPNGPVDTTGAAALHLPALPCPGRCGFCSVWSRGWPPDAPPIYLAELLYRAAVGVPTAQRGGTFQIDGTDIAGHPDLESMVELARLRGFTTIAASLSPCHPLDEARVDALGQAGLSEATLALYGATPSTHDAVMGVPGAFVVLRDNVARLRRRGIEVWLTTVVVFENVSELERIPAVAQELGARFGAFGYPYRAPDEPPWRVARMAPRLSDLPAAVRQRMKFAIPCLGTKYGAAANGIVWTAANQGFRAHLPEYAPGCDGCGRRAACMGLPTGYLASHGADELRPFRQGHPPRIVDADPHSS